MPAQDRVRSDQAMATQCAGQPPDEGGEHGSVRPVQAWSWIGAAQDGDLVAQHEELDVLGGGRAAHQQDQSEHLPEDQVEQPQRHIGIMPTRRSPLVSDPARILAPHRHLLSDPDARFHDLEIRLLRQPCRAGTPRRNHVRQLEALGYKVTLEPAA